MTTIQENARPLPLIGQSVGQAQATLTRLLGGILAGTGTSYQAWLGLQRLNALGGELGRDAYERDLSDWLQLNAPGAAGVAGDLVASGLAESDGDTIRMSDAGRGLRQDVLAKSAVITGPVLASLDRADLETTIRTLEEITSRVRATFATEES